MPSNGGPWGYSDYSEPTVEETIEKLEMNIAYYNEENEGLKRAIKKIEEKINKILDEINGKPKQSD